LECESGETPDRFFELAHWGCGIFSQVDGWTGRVYLTGGGERRRPRGRTRPPRGGTPDIRLDEGGGPKGAKNAQEAKQAISEPGIVLSLELQAHSVEEWLEAWLCDGLDQGYGSRPELLGPGMPRRPKRAPTLPPRDGWAWYQEPVPPPGAGER